MPEVGRIFNATAGLIVSAGMTVGLGAVAFGSCGENQNPTTFDEALMSQGLTKPQVSAIHGVVGDVSDVRGMLEYRPPYSDCNVKVFDVSLGGCAPELLPEAGKAIELMDRVEVNLQTANNSEAIEIVEAVEESVKTKKQKIDESDFTVPIGHETYSAERLALHDLEEELDAISNATALKESQARLDSNFEPSVKYSVSILGAFAAGIASVGFGWRKIYLSQEKSKAKKS
jgi:hypothetical protein